MPYPYYNNPYAQRLMSMEQQFGPSNNYTPNNYNPYTPQTQPIQNLNQNQQPQAMCCFVGQASELASLNLMPNTYYMGLNLGSKEIYLRHLNNDGNVEVETYSLASNQQEKSQLQLIAERLDIIDSKLNMLPVPPINNDLFIKEKVNEPNVKSNAKQF